MTNRGSFTKKDFNQNIGTHAVGEVLKCILGV